MKRFQISKDPKNPDLRDLETSLETSKSNKITGAYIQFKIQQGGKTQTRRFMVTGIKPDKKNGYCLLNLEAPKKEQEVAKAFLGTCCPKEVRYSPDKKTGEWVPNYEDFKREKP